MLEYGRVIAQTSLVRLMSGIDRTSDMIHKLHFLHFGGYFEMIVVGRVELFLRDDHCDAQR